MQDITKQKTQVTNTGITGLDQVDEDTFFRVGKELSHIEHGLQWAIGDWYNAIPAGKGNKYASDEGKKAACEKVGLNPRTANEYGQVASKFTLTTRVVALTFNHHRMLVHSDLTNFDRQRLLKRAIEGKTDSKGKVKVWSSSRLKYERDKELGISRVEPHEEFAHQVDALADAVVKALPKTAGKNAAKTAVKGVKKIADELQHEFSKAVEKAAYAKAKIKFEAAKKAQEEADAAMDNATRMQAGVKAFMTKEEFVLVRKCLHPDINPHPKAAKAFAIFNRLVDVKTWQN